jgi:hypothetical protein
MFRHLRYFVAVPGKRLDYTLSEKHLQKIGFRLSAVPRASSPRLMWLNALLIALVSEADGTLQEDSPRPRLHGRQSKRLNRTTSNDIHEFINRIREVEQL